MIKVIAKDTNQAIEIIKAFEARLVVEIKSKAVMDGVVDLGNIKFAISETGYLMSGVKSQQKERIEDMKKEEIKLSKATRDELIQELKNRESITTIKINSGNGADIKSISGNVSVSGEAYIFVVIPN